MSKRFCDGCSKEHEDHNWKTYYEGGALITVCSIFFTPTKLEWVPQKVKDDRVQHAKDTIQPWRGGTASKEFVRQYPEQANKIFSKKEIKKSKCVWKDVKGLEKLQ